MFRSVPYLKAAIDRFVAETNSNPKPFVWTADTKRVLAAVKRGKQAFKNTALISSRSLRCLRSYVLQEISAFA